jgi:hypothetical protein
VRGLVKDVRGMSVTFCWLSRESSLSLSLSLLLLLPHASLAEAVA